MRGPLTDRDRDLLRSCYRSCLDLAHSNGLETIAFCCISTGVFGYPVREAAAVAISAVRAFFARGGKVRVIFNVFSAEDCKVYEQLLGFAAC